VVPALLNSLARSKQQQNHFRRPMMGVLPDDGTAHLFPITKGNERHYLHGHANENVTLVDETTVHFAAGRWR